MREVCALDTSTILRQEVSFFKDWHSKPLMAALKVATLSPVR